MKKKYSSWLFVFGIIIIPLSVFSFVSWFENKFHKLPVLYENKETNISFSFANQNGQTVDEKTFQGKVVVVDFFFTHCPSICPKMTNNLTSVRYAFKNDTNVVINSFSIDPERDSIEALAVYAKRFNVTGGWNFLTGSKQNIYRVARKGFYITATDGDGGPNDFIHSDQLVLVDQKGRIRGYYDGTDASVMPQLINDIKQLKREN
jgi:protein SCO1/2